MGRNPGVVLLTICYLAGVAALVFTPISWKLNRLTVKIYVWWHYTAQLPGDPGPETFGFVLNVILFLPLGFVLSVLLRRPLVALLISVAISAGIEAIQLVPDLHRQATVGDLLSNTLGAVIGCALALAFHRFARSTTAAPG